MGEKVRWYDVPFEIESVPGLSFQNSVWNRGGEYVEMIARFQFERYVGSGKLGEDEVEDMTCSDCGQHLGWELDRATAFYGYCDRCAFRHVKYSVIRPRLEVEKK